MRTCVNALFRSVLSLVIGVSWLNWPRYRSSASLSNTIQLFWDLLDFQDDKSGAWETVETLCFYRYYDVHACWRRHSSHQHRHACSYCDDAGNAVEWALSAIVSESRLHVDNSAFWGALYYSLYDGQPPHLLDLVLRAGNNQVNVTAISGGFTILHKLQGSEMRRPGAAAAFLITRGANLHRKGYDEAAGLDIETPLSLAMRSASSFYRWREALRGADVDLDGYLACACQEDLIRDWGWTKAALVTLFKHSLDDLGPPKPPWCCCMAPLIYPFEPQWQRLLQKIKGGQSQGDKGEIYRISGTSTIKNFSAEDDEQDWEDVTDGDPEQGLAQRWQDSYDFLCWRCWNGLPPEVRGEGRTRCEEVKDRSDGGDSLDKGDSPFLLSLPL